MCVWLCACDEKDALIGLIKGNAYTTCTICWIDMNQLHQVSTDHHGETMMSEVAHVLFEFRSSLSKHQNKVLK